MRRRYPNPFGGRPTPFKLTSYFLLSPSLLMALVGESESGALQRAGQTSLFKSLAYHRKRGQVPPLKLRERLLATLPSVGNIRDRFEQAMVVAVDENEPELALSQCPTDWECFLAGFYQGADPGAYSYASRYMLELEEAIAAPKRLIDGGDFSGASDALATHPLTAQMISPEGHVALANVTSRKHLVFVQWSITLEFALSHFAAGFAAASVRSGAEDSDIAPLFIEVSGPPRTSGQMFMKFLMASSNQKSMMLLVKKLARGTDKHKAHISLETLKRWSNGKTLPDAAYVSVIAQFCCPKKEPQLLTMLGAARYLTFLGFVSESLLLEISKLPKNSESEGLFRPWPELPFGMGSFEEWCRERYVFWYAYHRDRLSANAGAAPA